MTSISLLLMQSCIANVAILLQGTKQIDRPKIVGTCKRLGVDYAMAMTGFDIHGGRSVPQFRGVIVCEEFVDLVEEAWWEEQRFVPPTFWGGGREGAN